MWEKWETLNTLPPLESVAEAFAWFNTAEVKWLSKEIYRAPTSDKKLGLLFQTLFGESQEFKKNTNHSKYQHNIILDISEWKTIIHTSRMDIPGVNNNKWETIKWPENFKKIVIYKSLNKKFNPQMKKWDIINIFTDTLYKDLSFVKKVNENVLFEDSNKNKFILRVWKWEDWLTKDILYTTYSFEANFTTDKKEIITEYNISSSDVSTDHTLSGKINELTSENNDEERENLLYIEQMIRKVLEHLDDHISKENFKGNEEKRKEQRKKATTLDFVENSDKEEYPVDEELEKAFA